MELENLRVRERIVCTAPKDFEELAKGWLNYTDIVAEEEYLVDHEHLLDLIEEDSPHVEEPLFKALMAAFAKHPRCGVLCLSYL